MIFRPNVAAIVTRHDGKILLCERREPRGSWQFPQGGVETGETARDALHRELLEETGLPPETYQILERREGYQYAFPDGRTKKGFHGQIQTYFLVRGLVNPMPVSLTGDDPEFLDWKWIQPADFQMAWLPAFKRKVYHQVFKDFFSLSLY